ncbi:MAG: Calcineurin-like phosphoesterase [Candidatus Argoarchaeum ethanivorans]|uniref:Calcineurin-like phosphoesterase n=1 Tax=Candidatus Argoarchaeum ethanivorans TaxID=2608793 RepID=A0A811TEU8_9EURY|nr:MAG: Calcineurin-like phosphoesterase [Candidatus Argoarchaeum ethanivorans]
MKRELIVGMLLVLLLACTTVQAQAATTEVHVVKYDSDGTTILNETNVTYQWMEKNLKVHGDGVTHYYFQGPTFDPDNLWDPCETINIKDKGAVKGTNVMDLCDLVGGMLPGDEVEIKASDGFSRRFAWDDVYSYSYQPEQGPMVLTWYHADDGYVPDYYGGMQLVFFADDNMFGNWDMHEYMDEKYWNYYKPDLPSSSGLSIKQVDEITIYSIEPLPQTVSAQSSVILWGPYITNTDTNSTTINWKSEDATLGTVRYATEEYYAENGEYDHAINDNENKQLHHLVVRDLTPNTVYHYQLTVGSDYAGDCTFRTYGDCSFTFIVYGDTREQTGLFTQMERHKLVSDRIAEEENISFVIHTGDFVCYGNDLDEWNDFFDAGRTMLANTTIYPVPGNHEDNHSNYYDAFRMSGWYSFDCGNAHFGILDSNDWAAPHTTEQTAWLQGDIESDATWKFVSFHHPIYSSDERHRGGWKNDAWEDILINNSVDAVFNGHVHVYERYEENGIQYVVLGCGGAPLYSLAEEKIAGYQNSFEHALGYARITIEGDKATMDVIKVADISEDNKAVTHIYPPDTVFETVTFNKKQSPANSTIFLMVILFTASVIIRMNKKKEKK